MTELPISLIALLQDYLRENNGGHAVANTKGEHLWSVCERIVNISKISDILNTSGEHAQDLNTSRTLNREAFEVAKNAYDAEFPDAMDVTYGGLRAGIKAYLATLPSEIPLIKPDASRYEIAERAIADCFPRSADPTGIYHLDSGNLQALAQTAIEIYEQSKKRELIARPESEWHEETGNVLWWNFPIDEPPYAGTPLDSDFPEYKTHWTPIENPTTKIEDGGPS